MVTLGRTRRRYCEIMRGASYVYAVVPGEHAVLHRVKGERADDAVHPTRVTCRQTEIYEF